jgi:hypothetical protein
MRRKEATLAQAEECWLMAEDYWTKAFPGCGGPAWVKASFLSQVFEVTLKQRNLRLPPMMRTATGTTEP